MRIFLAIILAGYAFGCKRETQQTRLAGADAEDGAEGGETGDTQAPSSAPGAPDDPCAAMETVNAAAFVKAPAAAAPQGALRVGLLSWVSFAPGEKIEGAVPEPRATLQKNADELICVIRRAAREGAKLVVTPELALVGYGEEEFKQPLDARRYAIVRDDEVLTRFANLAKELSVAIAVGFLEAGPSSPTAYNAAAVFGAGGELLAVHRKANLTPTEKPALSASPAPRTATVVDLPGFGKLGIAICADVYGEETMAALKAVDGLKGVAALSAWSGFRDQNDKPIDSSRGKVDYESLAAALGRKPVFAANHVELPVEGKTRIPAQNDVGLFGVDGGAFYQQNEAFLAIVDVRP